MHKETDFLTICDAIDEIGRFQALVTVRHYLAGDSHEQIADDLGLSEQQSIHLASRGLQHITQRFLGR